MIWTDESVRKIDFFEKLKFEKSVIFLQKIIVKKNPDHQSSSKNPVVLKNWRSNYRGSTVLSLCLRENIHCGYSLKRLWKSFLMSTQKVCFCGGIRKYQHFSVVKCVLCGAMELEFFIVLGLTIRQICGSFCVISKKGRKEIEEIVKEMKERDREER